MIGGLQARAGREIRMAIKRDFMGQYLRWKGMPFYQQFEHVIIGLLAILIAVVIVGAMWSLVLVVLSLALVEGFDPTDHTAFQEVFGAIFTVIIALEFNRSLLVVSNRLHSLIQVRTVILIALLAVVRKLIITDLGVADSGLVWALAGALVALGVVYWLVRDPDRSEPAPGRARGEVGSTGES
jgi:uncharacterized membrane protein (DUF373 family)